MTAHFPNDTDAFAQNCRSGGICRPVPVFPSAGHIQTAMLNENGMSEEFIRLSGAREI